MFQGISSEDLEHTRPENMHKNKLMSPSHCKPTCIEANLVQQVQKLATLEGEDIASGSTTSAREGASARKDS
jgi:hypothetical protein